MKRRELLTGAALLAGISQAHGFGRLGAGFARLGSPGAASRRRNLLFGVNLSGAEFSPSLSQTFPTNADFAYLASKGVSSVRLPIAWEQLQTTLLGALATTYLNSIKAAIDNAKAAGIGTIVELHNFGAYANATAWNSTVTYAGNVGIGAANVNSLGDGTLTSAAFVDVWTKLSTALVGRAGLIGYGLMNEPVAAVKVNLLTSGGYLGPAGGGILYNGNPYFTFGGGALSQLGSGTNAIAGLQPAWKMANTSFMGLAQSFSFAASQYTLSCYARAQSGTIQGFFQAGGNQSNGTPFTATTSWQRFSFTTTASAGANNAGIVVNSGSVVNLEVCNFQLELAAAPSTYQPNPFQAFAQAAITAIRAVDATTKIYVCGPGYSLATYWPTTSWDYVGLTGGNLIFEAHQYFDGAQGIGGGGTYSGTYTSYGIDSQSGVQAIAAYTAWLTTTGTTGYLGEFGVPNSVADNNAAWLPLQVNFIQALKTANVKASMWFYGSNAIQPANILNVHPVASVDDPRLLQMLAIK